MPPENIKNKLERYDKERRHKIIGEKETIIDAIKKRKLRLFRRICRMNDNRLTKHTVVAKIDGKPQRGRPRRE